MLGNAQNSIFSSRRLTDRRRASGRPASAALDVSIIRVITSGCFAVVIYFGFFVRVVVTEQGASASGAMYAIAAAAIGLACLFPYALRYARGRIALATILFLSYFLVASIAALVSAAMGFSSVRNGMRLATEMGALLTLFLFSYLAFSKNLVSLRFVLTAMILIALYTNSIAFIEFMSGSSVLRRLSAMAGRNYFGSATAAASIAALFMASPYGARGRLLRLFFLSAFAVLMVFTLLNGSRQALGVVMVGSLILSYFLFDIRGKILGLMAVAAIAIFSASYVFAVADADRLLLRFQPGAIEASGMGRLGIYGNALSEVDLAAAIVGRPDIYEVWNPNVTHPHNIFISTLRISGTLTTMFLLAAIMMAFFVAWKVGSANSLGRQELLLLQVLFLAALIYTLVSGNVTRTLHFYVFAGMLLGAVRRFSAQPRKETETLSKAVVTRAGS